LNATKLLTLTRLIKLIKVNLIRKRRMRTRFSVLIIVFLLLSLIIIAPAHATLLSISQVYIEPTGYEDPSTHEWKGSFWVITATVDTTESYILFNKTTSSMSGLNSTDGKVVVPASTLKITITPRQPYWEIPLIPRPYEVYPTTFGTHFNTIARNFPSKILENNVSELDATVLEPILPYQCILYTPFDVKLEKIGNNGFARTVSVNGSDTVVITNPADESEKLMIKDLGKLFSGLSTPALEDMLIFNNTLVNKSVAFKRSEVISAIKYGRDRTELLTGECYAFYWFGGGNYTVEDDGQWFVGRWDDDLSPNHIYVKRLVGPVGYNCLVRDEDFPGSYRGPDKNFGLDQYAYPIAADVWNDNPSAPERNDAPGKSLVNYLKWKFPTYVLDLNYLGQGWTITSGNKLRIYAPVASFSSLITIRISTELADSVVYQPIVANGKVEQVFWDSTKTTKSIIKDKDVAVLKIKQNASQSSKITVTPSIPANIPVSVSPQMDSSIVDPNAVHTFQFEIRNLGTQINQSSTITFTITNDLGKVTDSVTLDFDLIASENTQQNPPPENTGIEGDPLWMCLIAVISITVATASIYSVYTYRSSKKAATEKRNKANKINTKE
jgi:hypothetical protein